VSGLVFASVADVVAALDEAGRTPSEEGLAMTELDHGLQTAHELAQRHPADVELQIAGLVHDLGHAMGTGDAHARLGADALRGVLGERIARLVEAHVPAKRYLVTVDAEYRAALSPGSVASLALQGGALDDGEVARLAATPGWDDALELRRADDAAKTPGRIVPALDHWHAALRTIARA
jgi:predicted HD phosphohydrolase